MSQTIQVQSSNSLGLIPCLPLQMWSGLKLGLGKTSILAGDVDFSITLSPMTEAQIQLNPDLQIVPLGAFAGTNSTDVKQKQKQCYTAFSF